MLPALQSLDDEQRRKITIAPVFSFSLEQVKKVIANEIKKATSEKAENPNIFHTNASATSNMASSEEQNSNNQQQGVVCQICGKQGHIAARCFRRFSDLNTNSYRGRGSYSNRGQTNYNRGSYYGYQPTPNRGGYNQGFVRSGQYFRSNRFPMPNPGDQSGNQGFQGNSN